MNILICATFLSRLRQIRTDYTRCYSYQIVQLIFSHTYVIQIERISLAYINTSKDLKVSTSAFTKQP